MLSWTDTYEPFYFQHCSSFSTRTFERHRSTKTARWSSCTFIGIERNNTEVSFLGWSTPSRETSSQVTKSIDPFTWILTISFFEILSDPDLNQVVPPGIITSQTRVKRVSVQVKISKKDFSGWRPAYNRLSLFSSSFILFFLLPFFLKTKI